MKKYEMGAAALPVKAKFVHLGDRLLAIGRIRCGMLSVDEAARELGVHSDEVICWQQVHAFERMVSLEELRQRGSPEAQRLGKRAERLAELIARAERQLRELHQELIRGAVASNEPFVGAGEISNNFG
jgi:hypothetical protein